MDVSIRIDPIRPTLQEEVGRGRKRDWAKVGKSVHVTVLLPTDMVRWLNERGYVVSRITREAAFRLMGGGERETIRQEISQLRERIAILEAAEQTFADKQASEEASKSAERSRMDALIRLSQDFHEHGRGDSSRFSRARNLEWVRERSKRIAALRGADPEETLRLVSEGSPT